METKRAKKKEDHKYTMMTDAEFVAIRRLVLYLAPDEGKNFAEAGKPKNHIFRDVLVVSKFLDTWVSVFPPEARAKKKK